MDNFFDKLPIDLAEAVLALLHPDEAVQLYLALSKVDHFAFDWITITKRERTKMLANTEFCNKLKPDVHKSRDPRNLKPSVASGLPLDRTYKDLLNDHRFDPVFVGACKTQDLERIRSSLLFTSSKFRNLVDAPSKRSKEELNIPEGSTATYQELLAAVPEDGTDVTRRIRNGFKSWRIRDEIDNTKYQQDTLRDLMLRMHAEPDFLDHTCRKCFSRTVKRGRTAPEMVLLHGVVFCASCSRINAAAGPICFDRILRLGSTIDRRGCTFKTFDLDGVLHISKVEADLFAHCCFGTDLVDAESQYPPALLYNQGWGGFGWSIGDWNRDPHGSAVTKYNFCNRAAMSAILWYIQGRAGNIKLGHHLPDTIDRAIQPKYKKRIRLTEPKQVLRIYNSMARMYDNLPPNVLFGLNDPLAYAIQPGFAACFWHEQLYSQFGEVFVDVLYYQLKVPPHLFPQRLSSVRKTSGLTITVSEAKSIVLSYFGYTLDRVAAAMMSLCSTTGPIPMDMVVQRARDLPIDRDGDSSHASTFGMLSIMGKGVPSRIYGEPLNILPGFWPLGTWPHVSALPGNYNLTTTTTLTANSGLVTYTSTLPPAIAANTHHSSRTSFQPNSNIWRAWKLASY